jgi:hypothetical protein
LQPFDGLDRNPERTARERRRRSIALGVVLAGLVLLTYAMTLVRLHS